MEQGDEILNVIVVPEVVITHFPNHQYVYHKQIQWSESVNALF